MPRLVPMPVGLRVTSRAPLSGPRSASSGSTESLTGFVQTVASPFGLWRWQFTYTQMVKAEARRFRGWIVSLHGGANATRVTFKDPDEMGRAEQGVTMTPAEERGGVSWSNGATWSNGLGWSNSPPLVAVSAAAAKGDSIVTLADEFWRDSLNYGDQIGFGPYYFGMHVITEVLDGGQFRIWPPLRAALTTDSWATLRPVMCMRLESESSATLARGIMATEASTVTLTEVLDENVRDFYTG